MRRKLVYVIGITAIAVSGIAYTLTSGNEPLLGLDLQGGASVVLEPTTEASEDELNLAVEIIRNRVDGLGVAEPEISTQGGNILVQLPGVDDQQRAIDLVGQTAELRFRPVLDWYPEDAYQGALEDATGTTTTTIPVEGEETGTDDGADDTTAGTNEPVSSTIIGDGASPRPGRDGFVSSTIIGDGADGAGAGDGGLPDIQLYVDEEGNQISAEEHAANEAAAAEALKEQAQSVVDAWALTRHRNDPGAVPAAEEVVLATYDEDGNVDFRYRLGPAAVTGEGLNGADDRFDALNGWFVALDFKGGTQGIDSFNDLSRECFDRMTTCPTNRIAIEIDNEVVSAPSIQDTATAFVPFEANNITITGEFTEREVSDLSLVLDYGALPLVLEAQESRIVSASLGSDALRAGVVAGLIGLAIVSLYLIIYYKLLGLVAIFSLALSGALLWTIISWLGESRGLALTLSGVTGLVVAIGVSVDSNVVYFEHLKEDVRSGRTVRSAIDRAFPVAFSTIVKADVASLIAAGVLYLLTVGQVRGFALYLGLATILDLVATYFFMGPMIGLLVRLRLIHEKPGRFGISRATTMASTPTPKLAKSTSAPEEAIT